jgi:hypothetical protein
MTGFVALAATGKSIERLLNMAFDEQQPVPPKKTKAILVRTDDLSPRSAPKVIGSPALSIFLYRVDFNKTMRAAWSGVGSVDGKGHLALDLHYLLTAWGDNAEHEHMIMGRTLQALEQNPIFSGPLLYSPSVSPGTEPQWATTEAVQVMLEEISTEALMRTFDSLPTDYRLTVPYIARVVRIDTKQTNAVPPVTDAKTDIYQKVAI